MGHIINMAISIVTNASSPFLGKSFQCLISRKTRTLATIRDRTSGNSFRKQKQSSKVRARIFYLV